MVNIAIVEDNAADMAQLKKCLAYVKKKSSISYCITEFIDAEHFIFRSSSEFDLVFLDIQMASINGLEAAKKIREQNKLIGIVFVTNMRQLAINGYEVNALDFIVKPVTESDFYLKMQHILSRLNFSKKDQVVVGVGDKLTILPVNSILYLEVSGHYVTYHTSGEAVQEYITLKEAEKKLSAYPYFRKCSRFYIVNLNHVDEINGNEVCVGGKKLALSRSFKADFCKKFAEYFFGGG